MCTSAFAFRAAGAGNSTRDLCSRTPYTPQTRVEGRRTLFQVLRGGNGVPNKPVGMVSSCLMVLLARRCSLLAVMNGSRVSLPNPPLGLLVLRRFWPIGGRDIGDRLACPLRRSFAGFPFPPSLRQPFLPARLGVELTSRRQRESGKTSSPSPSHKSYDAGTCSLAFAARLSAVSSSLLFLLLSSSPSLSRPLLCPLPRPDRCASDARRRARYDRRYRLWLVALPIPEKERALAVGCVRTLRISRLFMQLQQSESVNLWTSQRFSIVTTNFTPESRIHAKRWKRNDKRRKKRR